MDTGIYRIQNKLNKRNYIGSSINLDSRISSHFSLLKKGKHFNSDFQDDFNLYGIESFEVDILKYCKKDELIEIEQFYISKNKNIYNKRSSKIGSKSRLKAKKIYLKQRLEEDLIDKLKDEASRRNRSVTNLIETILKKELDLL